MKFAIDVLRENMDQRSVKIYVSGLLELESVAEAFINLGCLIKKNESHMCLQIHPPVREMVDERIAA